MFHLRCKGTNFISFCRKLWQESKKTAEEQAHKEVYGRYAQHRLNPIFRNKTSRIVFKVNAHRKWWLVSVGKGFVATNLNDVAPNEGPQKSPATVHLSRKSIDSKANIWESLICENQLAEFTLQESDDIFNKPMESKVQLGRILTWIPKNVDLEKVILLKKLCS